jgi:hypothetical protein
MRPTTALTLFPFLTLVLLANCDGEGDGNMPPCDGGIGSDAGTCIIPDGGDPDANPDGSAGDDGDFAGQDGTYQSPSPDQCDIGSFQMSTSGAGITLSPFGANDPATFQLVAGTTDSADADALIILGAPDHHCVITIDLTTQPVSIDLVCTNNNGGICTGTFQKQ